MNHSKIQRIYKRLSILALLTLGLSVSAFASDPITVTVQPVQLHFRLD